MINFKKSMPLSYIHSRSFILILLIEVDSNWEYSPSFFFSLNPVLKNLKLEEHLIFDMRL